MKKIIATMVMAVVMVAVAFAQDNNHKHGNRPDPSQMAQKMTEMMVSRYGLNDTQKAGLLTLNKKYAGKMPMMGGPRGGHGPGMKGGRPGMKGGKPNGMRPDSTMQRPPRPSNEEMEKHRKEMDANRTAYNAELKKIMTKKQYKQYTEDQQRHGRPEKKNDSK